MQLIPMARELGVPLVATNDVHYVSPEDAPIQELVVCVQTNTTLSDPEAAQERIGSALFQESAGDVGHLQGCPGSTLQHDSHRGDV